MTVPARMRIAFGLIAIVIAAASLAESASDHDDAYVYRLPYGDAVSFSVLQGYGSRLSHRGPEYYTVDFGMPEGTLVYSAREGTVIHIEDRFNLACWLSDCTRYANFVEIQHPDGTIGKYFHLQQGSLLVTRGQWVERGEPIARSGDTGYSTTPHLHFGVYRTSGNGEAQSIAVRFAVRGGLIGRPRTGARYTNAGD